MVAHYEYDPYGKALVADGPAAKANPYRFSTKYSDDETSLYYYGYRYYSAETGRWVSRDPLSDIGSSAWKTRYIAKIQEKERENSAFIARMKALGYSITLKHLLPGRINVTSAEMNLLLIGDNYGFMFVYAANSPVNTVDALGLSCCSAVLNLAAATTAAGAACGASVFEVGLNPIADTLCVSAFLWYASALLDMYDQCSN
jgi:RHS repeat-associated protein